jgi:hypothetical protein
MWCERRNSLILDPASRRRAPRPEPRKIPRGARLLSFLRSSAECGRACGAKSCAGSPVLFRDGLGEYGGLGGDGGEWSEAERAAVSTQTTRQPNHRKLLRTEPSDWSNHGSPGPWTNLFARESRRRICAQTDGRDCEVQWGDRSPSRKPAHATVGRRRRSTRTGNDRRRVRLGSEA